ncbi:ParA family protein [Hyphomicrobium sp. ghe19]|uniref:ParA family protein n=1 Tax=Hyphomicrobium sp. ghe19 TaxID=2682968 RepID=UPI001366EDE7|nr:Iron-sulfur cluster carrier protein [Hyphomicrobium sp. ghe19]
MNIVGFLNSKGGVGKSTLCAAIAVRAAQENRRVCIVDLDPQESVADWWRRRGQPDNPTLFKGADRASDAVEALALDGWDWVFLDGPPGSLIVTDDAIRASNFVAVPMRASGLDLLASQDAVRLCQDAGVGYMVVLNACQSRSRDKLVEAARSILFSNQVPIADATITQRIAFVTAMTTGKTGAEKDNAAAEEIEALWKEIKSATLKGVRAKAKKEAAR